MPDEASPRLDLQRAELAVQAELDEVPPPPSRIPIEDAKLAKLSGNVAKAMQALPFYWSQMAQTQIEGLAASDLFSLNSVLGGTIETQTVATLNRIREVWDPDKEWSAFGFERSSQTFPDVRLVRRSAGTVEIALGIELKGWYLLSREEEPSFRYKVTPAALAPQDLLAVVPWYLTNVLSGAPTILEPYVEQGRYAALMRNYYWTVQRKVKGKNAEVIAPDTEVRPYMPAKAPMSDRAVNDGGGNFGRLARAKGDVMKPFCEAKLETEIAGIPAKHWIKFFKGYTDSADKVQVDQAVDHAMQKLIKPKSEERASEIVALLHELGQRLP